MIDTTRWSKAQALPSSLKDFLFPSLDDEIFVKEYLT